jgi:hypothetical protein
MWPKVEFIFPEMLSSLRQCFLSKSLIQMLVHILELKSFLPTTAKTHDLGDEFVNDPMLDMHLNHVATNSLPRGATSGNFLSSIGADFSPEEGLNGAPQDVATEFRHGSVYEEDFLPSSAVDPEIDTRTVLVRTGAGA